ncbi:GNAT family N-acetyltransferase [Aurantivibrio infirmus]
MNEDHIKIETVSWDEHQHNLKKIRHQVFVIEQKVPLNEEWDNLDGDAKHFLAFDGKNQAIGTARVLPNGQIGRMAVLKQYRRHGIGKKILEAIFAYHLAKGFGNLFLHAQVKAIPFYEDSGFVVTGESFMEAGIEHRTMELKK